MAYLSFLTSDEEASIAAESKGEWWLVSPKEKIIVTYYDGQGVFTTPDGEQINVFGWLARINFPKKEFDDETANMVGAILRYGKYYVDKALNTFGCQIYLDKYTTLFNLGDMVLFEDYEHQFEIASTLASVNDHIKEGRLTEVAMRSDVKLKIASQESNAVYGSLEEAKCCPNQGYFY